jgi:hypothetical protein
MRTRKMGTARTVLVTASFVALGAGTAAFPGSAFADTTSGDKSVLGGNQINAPISAPVDVCGNSVAVLGDAVAGCKGGAKVKKGSGGDSWTSGDHSVLGGNQINAPISAPVDVCGNAVGVLGSAAAGCKGGAKVKKGSGGGNWTSGDHSVLGGNQINAPISAPVNVCGNAVAVGGDALAGCKGGATVNGRDGGGYGGGDGYGTAHQAAPAAESAELSKLSKSPELSKLSKSPKLANQSGLSKLPGHQQFAPTQLRPAAAGESIPGGMENSAIYVLTVGALMAGASGAMAFARRIRFARR